MKHRTAGPISNAADLGFRPHLRKTLYLAYIIGALVMTGCGKGSPNQSVIFSSNFESGSIGSVTQLNGEIPTYQLSLRDDNHNITLPPSFRAWWHIRADNVQTDRSLRLEFVRLGFPHYLLPVYSYDARNWHYFSESEVDLAPECSEETLESCRLIVTKQFSSPTVWIARTFPYTTSHLAEFLQSIQSNPNVNIKTLGYSPQFRFPLYLVSISSNTANASDDSGHQKQTVWIHARTHAAETGSSYLLEGLIGAILAHNPLGETLRQNFIFKIVPMLNPDGVFAGNYRTNISSINLENQWLFDHDMPLLLTQAAPFENRLVNKNAMVPVRLDRNAPVTLALNLHSSNEAPDTGAYFFPHFGSDPSKYSDSEQKLWRKQINFIQSVATYYDDDYGGKIERPPEEGGKGFLQSFFPETW